MDNDFDNLLQFFDDVDNLTENVAPSVNLPKIYMRELINPFTLFTNEEFKSRYRFSKETVRDIILPELKDLTPYNNRGLPIALELQLVIALRFFATGSFQVVSSDLFYISQPTVCRIVKRISTALAKKLKKFINFPQGRRLLEMKKQFQELGATRNLRGLPNVVGAIDCTHIKITRPRGLQHSEVYRNRHGWFSINTQVIVDPNMKILDVVARWPGSSHDSRIYRNSRIKSRFTTREIDGVLVGDGGYACTTEMLTPLRVTTTAAEEKYNIVQVRTRNIVERTFGVLKRRFPCLQKGLGYKLKTTCNIILSCMILHNIAICYEAEEPFDETCHNMDVSSEISSSIARNDCEGLALRANLIRNLYS